MEICDNGVDDDGDFLVDCDDGDCAGHLLCPTDRENCVNYIDDDGDNEVTADGERLLRTVAVWSTGPDPADDDGATPG